MTGKRPREERPPDGSSRARSDGSGDERVSTGRSGTGTDPITLTVIWDRLVAACSEMGSVLQRTAKSEAVAAGQDFSTGIFDREGRMIAQGNFSPGHLGAMPYAVEHVLEKFPPSEFSPGDAILLNDSRIGNGHLPDIFVVSPAFADGAVVGFTVTTAHHVDVGGMVPGSQALEATEIYQEGLRLLPTKAVSEGRFEPWFVDLIEANVRLPEIVLDDLRAQLGANRRGGELLVELDEEYGRATLENCIETIITQSEQRTRSDLEALPDGSYTFTDVMDPVIADAEPVDLAVTVTIDGDEIVFDYTGTDPQTESAINAFINYTRAYSAFVLKAITQEHLPHNEGVLRPLTVRAPEECFFNADRTAAAGARAIISQHITDLCFGALAEVVPERVITASSHVANPIFSGVDPDTEERFILFDAIIGGTGALTSKDGEEGLCSSVNVTNIPVERHEANYPVLVDRLELIPDSGGAGEHRGGLGLRKAFTLLADDTSLTLLMNRNRTPPWGLEGGADGRRARARIEVDGDSREVHSKGHYEIDAGETLVLELSGAGGYGDPLARAPEAIRRDVEQGYVTPGVAKEEYGVVLDGSGEELVVDEAKTTALRARRRS